MNYALEADIFCMSSKQEIFDTAMAISEKRNGKVSSHEEDIMTIYFGNRIKTRIFGIWFLSESKRFQFPTKLQVNVQAMDSQSKFTLKFSDTLGSGIPDSYSETRYIRYYKNILDDFRDHLQIERIELKKETDGATVKKKSVPDYRLWAAFGVLFFIPTALVAFWYANKSAKEADSGNISEGIKNARRAKLWLTITFVAGILINVYLFICDILGVKFIN